VLAHKSKTKSPKNAKIGRKVAHSTAKNEHQFQGQKVIVTTQINDLVAGATLVRPNVKPFNRWHCGLENTVYATQLIYYGTVPVCVVDESVSR